MTDERRQSLLAKFRRTTRQRVAAIGRGVVELEHGDRDVATTIEEVARELHTLKGEARLLGFELVADVAHELEARLHAAIDGDALREPAFVAEILRGLERIETDVGDGGDARAPEPKLDAHRLGLLAEQVTEIALTQGRAHAVLEELEDIATLADGALASRLRHVITRAREQTRASEALSTELLESVRDLQLLPLEAGLARYPRAVRELAAAQGKLVHLVLEVGNAQIDREVLEALHEPLLHVLRNGVDHGCEVPSERVALGKPELATIRISAVRDGSSLELAIADDGRGVADDDVLHAARRRGLVGEAATLDLRTRDRLLFMPGFSTRAEITQVSGRGVGLDVVRQRVERLGGSVRLDSTLGVGTTIALRVPISAMMASALAVRIGTCQCALALESVVEIVAADGQAMERLGDALALHHEGELVPLRDLGALTGIGRGRSVGRVVVLEHRGTRCGLLVDRVLGERQILHRGKGEFLAGSRLLRDVGLSTDGVTTLVLDTAAIVEWSGGSIEEAPTAPELGVRTTGRVLIVDDSELTRDLLARLIRDRGHMVEEAVDGEEALAKIREHAPDVVFTDLEMPVLDGFGLLRRVRESAELRDLPIVVLSTRGGVEDIRRAAEAGATAYLVKSEFHERKLDRILARLFGSRSDA
jgi:two-component system chemotaxis sensor kinase CheA